MKAGEFMKLKYNISAFVFIGIFGALSHFVYEWSGNNIFLGYFFPINESTFEHLKMIFFPPLIYFIIEFFVSKYKRKNYFPAVLIGLLYGIISIITLFYTAKGVLGYTNEFINISIYYIALLVLLFKKDKYLKSDFLDSNAAFAVSLILISVISVSIVLWTYNPPNLNLFTDPTI